MACGDIFRSSAWPCSSPNDNGEHALETRRRRSCSIALSEPAAEAVFGRVLVEEPGRGRLPAIRGHASACRGLSVPTLPTDCGCNTDLRSVDAAGLF